MKENKILACSFFRGGITNTTPIKRPFAMKQLAKLVGGDYYKEKVEAIRNEKDEKKRKELKSQLDFILFAGEFTKRRADCIISYSGVVCMDVDGKDNPGKTVKDMRLTCLNSPVIHAFLLFYSPSGNGIKVFLRYDTEKYKYRECFEAFWMYFHEVLHINVDFCADVPRACFMSYDPIVMYNESEPLSGIPVEEWSRKYKEADLKKPAATPRPADGAKDENAEKPGQATLDHAMTVLARICEKKVDIAPTYNDYYSLGMALANFGNAGLPIFLKCCSFNTAPKRTDPKSDFEGYCHSTRHGYSVATFFDLCKKAGIDISRPESNEPTIGERIIDIENPQRLPLFPDWIFDKLPPLLKRITDHYEQKQQKCSMLLGSLGVISSALPNLYINYDGDLLESNFYVFIIGASGSGKGKVKNCLRLVKPINDRMKEKSRNEYADYRVQLQKLKGAKGKAEEMEQLVLHPVPSVKMFVLPGNISASFIVRMLKANGGRGLMFETESDTLANMLSKDYGDFSDLLRKVPHHEVYTMARKGDEQGEEYTIEHPCLSVVLTGTPNQLPNLIHNTQDGLFGRFCYWYMSQPPMWRNPFAHKDEAPDSVLFDELAKDIQVTYIKLECIGEDGVEFTMTDEQIKKMNDIFLDLYLKDYKLYDGRFDGVMYRMGVTNSRLAMTLTALRQPGVDSFDHKLVCSDTDFDIAMAMTETMEPHSTYSFRRLDSEQDERTQIINTARNKHTFYALLPDEFTQKDAIVTGQKLKISRTSIYRYLKDFAKDIDGKGMIIKKIDSETYMKIVEKETKTPKNSQTPT